MAASWLQRWAIILATYSYNFEYIPTKEHGNADCLSRLPMGNDCFWTVPQSNVIVSMIQKSRLTSLPISAEEIKKATDNDHILQKVIGKMKKGWLKMRMSLKNCNLISINVSSWVCRVGVSCVDKEWEQVLTEIHEGHTGIVHMKAVARVHVWWPNIDREVESCVYECDDCQRNSRNPARAPLQSWEQP